VLEENTGTDHLAKAQWTTIDFGCGTGLASPLLKTLTQARLIGIDLSPGLLAKAEDLAAGC